MKDNKRHNKPNSALLALAGSALGLPGIAGKAVAAEQVTESQVDYSYTRYAEEDMPQSKQSGATGDTERYTIDTHQLRVVRPWGDTYDLSVDLMYETMSGASPWYIVPGANGEPLQVMSGATIEETRTDLLATVRKHYEQLAVSTSLGFSEEDDYSSLNLGLQGEWELSDKQHVLTAGIGYSDDDINPVDRNRFPNRVASETKNTLSTFVGFAHVLNAQTTLQASVSYTMHDGFLSDPYKLAYVNNNLEQDSRPDRREMFTAMARMRRFFPGAKGALHLDYRFFDDDWDITSHTFEAAWHQNLPGEWLLSPSVRYYSQSQAFFYAPYYNQARNDNLRSSDYRLSPYGALSFRLNATKKIGTWAIRLGFETYKSEADLSLKSVKVENPGLVEFSTFTLSLSKYF